MKRSIMAVAVLMAVLVAGFGCSDSNSSGAGTAISEPTAAQAKTANVTFSAKFPSKTVKSLLDPATETIKVEWCSGDCMAPGGSVILSRQTPSVTLKLAPITHYFAAAALDASGNVMENAGTAGSLNVGDNTVYINFLNGKWTFRDAATGTTAAPITLSDNTTVIDGFYLNSAVTSTNPFDALMGGPTNTGSSLFNPNMAFLWSQYLVTWGTHTTGGTAWDNTGWQAAAYHASQFTGGTANVDALDFRFYNMIQGCYDDWNGGCQSLVGEPNIGLIGNVPEDIGACPGCDSGLPTPPDETNPDPMVYAMTGMSDGNTMTGYFVEWIMTSQSTTIISTGVTGTSIISAKAVSATKSGSASVKASVLSAIKSQSSASFMSMTDSWYRSVVVCQDGFNGGTTGDGVDLGTWNFTPWICDQQGNCTPDTTPGATCGKGTQTAGVYEYYECGSVDCTRDINGICIGNGVPGECSYGVVQTGPNMGEYCACGYDRMSGTCYTSGCGITVPQPWNFADVNMDGVIDYGDWAYSHYMREDSTSDVWFYPVRLEGEPSGGTQIIIGKPQ